MTSHINIDPGFSAKGKGCACARFKDGELIACWYQRPSEEFTGAFATGYRGKVDVVRWEKPQVDGRGADGNVLIQLAAVGQGLATELAIVHRSVIVAVTPSQWKHSERKPQHHMRVWTALTEQERRCVAENTQLITHAIETARAKGALERWKKSGVLYYPKSFHQHNLLDAVAMGLTAEGRI